MTRCATPLLVLMLVAAACTGSPSPSSSSAVAIPVPAVKPPTASVPTATPPSATNPPPSSEHDAAGPTVGLRLLPDPERWVVVDDWGSRSASSLEANDREITGIDGLQLDFAPVGPDGVPDLGQLILVNYRSGERDEFENRWGGSSTMGDAIDFASGANGIGRSVRNEDMGFSTAQIWQDNLFVSMQSQVTDADLHEFALSMVAVGAAEWTVARSGAADQRLLAVEKAMQTIEVPVADDDPLPHWVLPEPWELEWVTDMTIWTPEQRAQRDGLAQASRRPDWDANQPTQTANWQFSFSATTDAAAQQFTPQISVWLSVFEDPPEVYSVTNTESVTALGLEGTLAPGSGRTAELGQGEVRVVINTTNLSVDVVREFLAAIEFASGDPLDGIIVNDPRFQPSDVEPLDRRPPSWHALWEHPEEPDAAISVWHLRVDELRSWMMARGDGLQMPADTWETIESGGVVDFTPDFVVDRSTTYDVATNLLIVLRNIERDELIPIDIEAWIDLAEPVNAKPLSPR